MPSWNEDFEEMTSCWVQAKILKCVTVYGTASLVTAFLKYSYFGNVNLCTISISGAVENAPMINAPLQDVRPMGAWEEPLA